jgi:hypothetical protein
VSRRHRDARDDARDDRGVRHCVRPTSTVPRPSRPAPPRHRRPLR